MFLEFHKLKDEVHIANTQITFVEYYLVSRRAPTDLFATSRTHTNVFWDVISDSTSPTMAELYEEELGYEDSAPYEFWLEGELTWLQLH